MPASFHVLSKTSPYVWSSSPKFKHLNLTGQCLSIKSTAAAINPFTSLIVMLKIKGGLVMAPLRQQGFKSEPCYGSPLIHCHHNLTSTQSWAHITTHLELFVYPAISLLGAEMTECGLECYWTYHVCSTWEVKRYCNFQILSKWGYGQVLFYYCNCQI